ncbi:MAG: hypothetical protein ACRC2S_24350 [Waterburya sp.]
MLLAIILGLLLISNWLLTTTVVFIPLNFIFWLQSLAYWGLALLILAFLAWCVGED